MSISLSLLICLSIKIRRINAYMKTIKIKVFAVIASDEGAKQSFKLYQFTNGIASAKNASQ